MGKGPYLFFWKCPVLFCALRWLGRIGLHDLVDEFADALFLFRDIGSVAQIPYPFSLPNQLFAIGIDQIDI